MDDVSYCHHDWVERTAIIKNIIKESDGRGPDRYFNKLRFFVCRKCAQVKKEIDSDSKGKDD